MAIQKYGIRGLLPSTIQLVSGPGCPICVTPTSYMEAVLALSQRKEVILATFGDLLRIPLGGNSLLEVRGNRENIQIIYSPLTCLKLAKEYPHKKIIFLAIGFETTTPIVAFLIKKAKEIGLDNFKILCGHKMMPPILTHLSKDPSLKVHGYLYPGHVTAITGEAAYSQMASQYHIPGVVAGFKPLEILSTIYRLIQLIEQKIYTTENLYAYAAPREGNPLARAMIEEVFEVADSEWRGIGIVPLSGYRPKEEYAEYDAWQGLDTPARSIEHVNPSCCCSEVLKGKLFPYECKLFGAGCTPQNPIGVCMVSDEGACKAYFKYYIGGEKG